jgi:hypothetical protein
MNNIQVRQCVISWISKIYLPTKNLGPIRKSVTKNLDTKIPKISRNFKNVSTYLTKSDIHGLDLSVRDVILNFAFFEQ